MIAADLRVLADAGAVAAAAAREVAQVLAAAARAHGSASMALAGGRTPRGLYRCLALDHRDDIAWDRVHVYWGDERDVPHDDERSNYRMARESLLDHVPVRPECVHPMPAVPNEPGRAAAQYEHTLRSHFDTEWPTFDLVLLGLGGDGHTASLFPRSPALDEASRVAHRLETVACRASESDPLLNYAPVEPHGRLTLTLPVLTHSRSIFVVVSGSSKADALRCALADGPDRGCPASLLRTARSPVVWWADAQAAAKLGPWSAQ